MAIEKRPPENTPETKLITISEVELKKMVEDAVLNALIEKQAAPAAPFNEEKLGNIIGAAVADGMKRNTRPKVTIGEYLRRGYSVFHPKGMKDTPHLTREVYQNGHHSVEDRLHDTEIELLNRITHGGRYIDRRVEVYIEQTGSDDVLHINFSNKVDNILALKDHVSAVGRKSFFEGMLAEIVKVQEAEDREATLQDEMKREQRREFLARKTAREQAVEA